MIHWNNYYDYIFIKKIKKLKPKNKKNSRLTRDTKKNTYEKLKMTTVSNVNVIHKNYEIKQKNRTIQIKNFINTGWPAKKKEPNTKKNCLKVRFNILNTTMPHPWRMSTIFRTFFRWGGTLIVLWSVREQEEERQPWHKNSCSNNNNKDTKISRLWIWPWILKFKYTRVQLTVRQKNWGQWKKKQKKLKNKNFPWQKILRN